MKSYTDLEQSKKLAEILPIESADMRYYTISQYNLYPCDEIVYTIYFGKPSGKDIPCWSLAALLDILESEIDGEEGETYQLNIEKDGTWWNVWYKERYDEANPIETASTEELVDACYEMIIKLHEQNLL